MKKVFLILVAISILSLTTLFTLQTFSKTDPNSYETVNSDLALLANYQSGEKPTPNELKDNKSSKKAKFDRNSAEKAGFNKKSIDTFEQLNDYNNELISDIGANFSNKELVNKYPLVKAFFDESTKRLKQGIITDIDYSKSSIGKSILFINTFADNSQNQCGTWGNPKPTSAKNWVTWNLPSSTPLQWGYHNTAGYVGTNDYTRSKSWNTYWCNYNSFRDHAIPKDINRFIEQNYNGWSPNGEPNPEVSSYTWPYWNWPAYAQWWHNTY